MILTRLKAYPDLTAIVPASRILPGTPEQEPVWPFIKTMGSTTRRQRRVGYDGGTVALDVTAFARATSALSGEDHCGLIGEHIEEALADGWVTLEGGIAARIELSDINIRQVSPSGDWQYFAQANVQCRPPGTNGGN